MMEKKRQYTVQSSEVIASALAAIRDGESQVVVARRFGISRGTLQNKLKKATARMLVAPQSYRRWRSLRLSTISP